MTLDAAQHKQILAGLLKDIYLTPNVGSRLGFKGGTAAMLFYELPRFSVDLDFDLLDSQKEDELFELLKEILSSYGDVKEARQKRHGHFFLLSYHQKMLNAPNVKVEINKRDFGSRYEVKNYLGVPMQVMVQADMVAHKMVAMLERIGKTNRDIFDVWFFLSNYWPLNKQIVERRSGTSYKEFLQKCIDSLIEISEINVLSGMGELLTLQQKAWAKSKLISETIFHLKTALSKEQQ